MELGANQHGTLHHANGVPWDRARLPWRWHRCRAQTAGRIALGGSVFRFERCPCGGVRVREGGPWLERNARRGRRRS